MSNYFQITLRAARISCGYTVKEVAQVCGVSSSTISKYERNSGNLPLNLMLKLRKLYNNVSLDLIYYGTESECHKHNRRRSTIAQAS